MPRRNLIYSVIALALLNRLCLAATSDLWGTNGERWLAGGRLPDFSYAGYHCGEAPLPEVPAGVSVKNFGAKGDGVTDDSEAFLDALASVKQGAIEVPPGRYVITRILEIKRSGVVLRGAGADKTVLFFPKTLTDVKPNWGATTTGERTSNYSWSGGFVWLEGNLGERPVTAIAAEAKRGGHSVNVSDAHLLHTGERIEVFETDNPDNSLAEELYSGDAGKTDKLLGSTTASLICRITKIEGNRISFDRPLRFAIHPRWHPQIRSFNPSVSESGVENLCFEFPNAPYGGHFTELGCNALAFSGVADCWARNLRITNADSGIFPGGCFCTIDGVVFESARAPDKVLHCTGHHGFCFEGDDNLFRHFDFRTRFVHDLTVSRCAGNVFADGRAMDLDVDHHERAPYENLFTDLDAGAGTRLWSCGGGAALGKHCAARGTFWNIRAARPQPAPPASFGPPSMNFVGIQSDLPPEENPTGRWWEAIPPSGLVPQDLHAAQLARRLAH